MKKTALAFVTMLVACAHPQLAYHFAVPTAGSEPVLPHVARVLASQGQQVMTIDPTAGIIYTRWQDTGFMYGEVENVSANIVRRYVVTVAPAQNGSELAVRQESQRCGQGRFSIGDAGLQGACVQMEGLIEKQQKELDTLGAQLQTALK